MFSTTGSVSGRQEGERGAETPFLGSRRRQAMAGGTALVIITLARRLASSGDGGQGTTNNQPSSQQRSGGSSLYDSRLMALLVGTVVLAVARRLLSR